jgi:hypothetical protein
VGCQTASAKQVGGSVRLAATGSLWFRSGSDPGAQQVASSWLGQLQRLSRPNVWGPIT